MTGWTATGLVLAVVVAGYLIWSLLRAEELG